MGIGDDANAEKQYGTEEENGGEALWLDTNAEAGEVIENDKDGHPVEEESNT